MIKINLYINEKLHINKNIKLEKKIKDYLIVFYFKPVKADFFNQYNELYVCDDFDKNWGVYLISFSDLKDLYEKIMSDSKSIIKSFYFYEIKIDNNNINTIDDFLKLFKNKHISNKDKEKFGIDYIRLYNDDIQKIIKDISYHE